MEKELRDELLYNLPLHQKVYAEDHHNEVTDEHDIACLILLYVLQLDLDLEKVISNIFDECTSLIYMLDWRSCTQTYEQFLFGGSAEGIELDHLPEIPM